MEKLTICYEFEFRLTVRKKNGKLYKGHHIVGLGLTFWLALWDVYHRLKKRNALILEIHQVKPLRVAFAFDQNAKSVKTTIAAHPPQLPGNLAAELTLLHTANPPQS